MTRLVFVLVITSFMTACNVQPKNDMTTVSNTQPVSELLTLCEDRNGSACTRLAALQLEATDDANTRLIAKGYYEKSCEYEHAFGCYALGMRYQKGVFEEKDILKSAQYYSKACNLGKSFGKSLGSSLSCDALGYNDHESGGVLSRSPLADSFYRPLCNDGDANACFALGRITALKEKTPTRNNESIQLYKKGCDGGNATSCHMAAYMLTLIEVFDGTNPYDPSHHTYKYWEKACNLGHKNSCGEVTKYNEGYGR